MRIVQNRRQEKNGRPHHDIAHRAVASLLSHNKGRRIPVKILKGQRLIGRFEIMKTEAHNKRCKNDPVKCRQEARNRDPEPEDQNG